MQQQQQQQQYQQECLIKAGTGYKAAIVLPQCYHCRAAGALVLS
jgi:hypothetical protein